MFDKDKHNNESDDIQLVLLRTANNNFELDLITNLLEDNNIPYVLKDHGSGGYMRIIGGSSIYGTDILVDEGFFERANEILDSIPINE